MFGKKQLSLIDAWNQSANKKKKFNESLDRNPNDGSLNSCQNSEQNEETGGNENLELNQPDDSDNSDGDRSLNQNEIHDIDGGEIDDSDIEGNFSSSEADDSGDEEILDESDDNAEADGTIISALDIGLFVNRQTPIDNATKHQLVKECWRPDESYKIPVDAGRKFKQEWFRLFPWLVYSHNKKGAFCRPCVLFSQPKKSKRFLIERPHKTWRVSTYYIFIVKR